MLEAVRGQLLGGLVASLSFVFLPVAADLQLAQDDDDLTVEPNRGRLNGLWDDDDLSEGLPAGPASEPLSDFLSELCDGNIYVNVHGTGDQGTGALRGNLEPTRRGERVCRALAGKSDDDDDD